MLEFCSDLYSFYMRYDVYCSYTDVTFPKDKLPLFLSFQKNKTVKLSVDLKDKEDLQKLLKVVSAWFVGLKCVEINKSVE